MISNIVISVVIGLVSLAIGLFLRHRLVLRLKQTIFDDWISQTLGVLLVLLAVILGGVVASLLINSTIISAVLNDIRGQKNAIQVHDLITLAWSLIESLLIIVLGIGIARTAMKQAIKGLGENRIDINIRTLIGRIIFVIILLIVIFWLLSIWQIGLSVPLAILGASAAVFTLAIQDILKDLVAGFYLLIERPFRIGDVITVANPGFPTRSGVVEDIQLRSTRMRVPSGEQLAVPNALVFNGLVVNNTYFSERRVTITFSFAESDFDKDKTPAGILDTLKHNEEVMVKPEPIALISGFAGQRVTLKVHFWVESGNVTAVSDIMPVLHAAFPTADIAAEEAVIDV